MPTPTKGPRLGGGPSHERMLIANLARSLFVEGRIRTTQAKAKRLRPQAERLITFAKRGDIAARRQVLTVVRDKEAEDEARAEAAEEEAGAPEASAEDDQAEADEPQDEDGKDDGGKG